MEGGLLTVEIINLLCGLAPDWASSDMQRGLARWAGPAGLAEEVCWGGGESRGRAQRAPRRPCTQDRDGVAGSQLAQLEPEWSFPLPRRPKGTERATCLFSASGEEGWDSVPPTCHVPREGSGEPTVVIADLSTSCRHMS